MPDSDREDLHLSDGTHCKYKPMPDGEIRTSMTTTDGTKISITMAPQWNVCGEFPWQKAHFHKGLTETYQLVSGWMQLIWIEGCVCTALLSRPGYTRAFSAGIPHIVLLGPGTRIITTSFGIPVPNPDKKGNDWWDVDDDFHQQITFERGWAVDQIRKL